MELLRRARRRARVVQQGRRWRPDHVRLQRSGHLIYVEPRDVRGWKVVEGLGRGHQPALIDLWVRAVDALRPVVAVDVGANYGEMVLNARYPEGSRAVAVEANPGVAHHLARSLAAHPDRARIELVEALAGLEGGTTATLRVDPRWSGTASTGLGAADGLLEHSVPVVTLDDLIGAPPERLLLKVDTEGAEVPVLEGAARLLAGAGSVVALVEHDPDHLRRHGRSAEELFALLRAVGPCWRVEWDGTTAPAEDAPCDTTDLLAVSDPATAAALGLVR